VDLAGAALAAAGLGGVVYALIEGGAHGGRGALLAALLGTAALAAFLATEARRRDPMLPLSLFRVRAFSAVNALTLAVYFALSGATFLAVLELQLGLGWTPLSAGAALLPVTLLVLGLSPVAARLSSRAGAWPFLSAGPVACAAGLVLLAGIHPGASYVRDVFPGVAVLGVGLGLTVAPLTTTALEAAPPERAGVASAVNNAVARLAGLLAVAALPAAAGISAADLAHGALGPGYRSAMLLAAGLAAAGGALSALTLRPARRRSGGRHRAGVATPATRGRARADRIPPRPRGRARPPGRPPRG
jgi:hypothetical protein